MKKLTKILTGLLLTFLLSNGVNAQSIGSITPSNAGASASEIHAIFGSQINVTAAQIQNFYQAQWLDEPYSSLCTNSNLSVGFMNNDVIHLEWTPQPGKTFQVSYLRLSDGTTQTFSTNKSYMTLPLPNDLYLFSLQTDCGSVQSTLGIIIIDKPVMRYSKEECLCLDYSQEKKSRIGSGLKHSLFADYIWSPDYPNTVEEYYIEVIGNNNQLHSGFHATIEFEDGVPQRVGVNPLCWDNVRVQSLTNSIYAVNPFTDEDYGTFTFSQNGFFAEGMNNPAVPALRFVSYGNSLSFGELIIRKCLDPATVKRRSSEGETGKMAEGIALKNWPNPSIDQTTIEYVLSTSEEISLSLIDAYGQSVRTLKEPTMVEAGAHQLTLDLGELPSGIYWCVLKTQQERKIIRLIKTQ